MKHRVSGHMGFLGNRRILAALVLLVLTGCSFESSQTEPQEQVGGSPTGLMEVADVDVRRGDAGAMDPSTWEVSRSMSLTLKLVEPYTSVALQGRQFHVSLSKDENHSGTPQLVTTRADGRADWQDQLRYAYTDHAQDLPRFIVVTGANTASGFEKRVIPIHLNPWAEDDSRFFWNTAFKGAPPALQASASQSPTIDVENLNFEHVQNNHDQVMPDRQMQLTEKRRYHVSFAPKLRRPPVFGPRATSEDLPQGAVLDIRLLVSAPLAAGVTEADLSKQTFAGAFRVQKPVDARGRVEFDLALATDFSMHPILESRVQLTAAITPVGSGALPRSQVGVVRSFAAIPNGTDQMVLRLDTWAGASPAAFFSAFENITGSKKILALKEGSADLWRVAPALDPKTPPVDAYLAQLRSTAGHIDQVLVGSEKMQGWKNLSSLDSSRAVEQAWTSLLDPDLSWENAQEQRAENIDTALAPLCKRSSDFLTCKHAPAKYFVVDRAEVVDEIDTTKPVTSHIGRENDQLNITYFDERLQTVRFQRGQKNASGNEFKAGGQLGWTYIGTGPSTGFNLKSERESFWTQEVAVARDARERASVNNAISLTVDWRAVKFTASVMSCAQVRLRMRIGEQPPAGSYGLMICRKIGSRPVSETWYSLRDRTAGGSSGMVDARNIRDRGWWKVVRGVQRFQDFKARVQLSENVFRFRRIEPFEGGANVLLEQRLPATPETVTVLNPDDGFSPGVIRIDEVVPWSQWKTGHLGEREAYCRRPRKEATVAQLAVWQSYCQCLYRGAAEAWSYDEFVSRSGSDWQKSSGLSDRCAAQAKLANEGSGA